MKITQEAPDITVGQMAAFVAHALSNGCELDTPVAIKRARSSTVTEMSIEVMLPGFKSTAEAASIVDHLRAGSGARKPGPVEQEEGPK